MGLQFTVENSIKGPEIDHIDNKNGIVYFKPHNFRLDIYANTKKHKGEHVHKLGRVYPDHRGKGFVLFNQEGIGATSWTIPDLGRRRGSRRKYFRFALRDENLNRTTFSTAIVASAVISERGIKIKLISM